MSRRWRLLGLAFLVALPGCAANLSNPRSQAKTGTIRGTLRLPTPSGASAMASASGGAPVTASAETPLDAVVYLESVPAAASSRVVPSPPVRAAAAKNAKSKTTHSQKVSIDADPEPKAVAHPFDERVADQRSRTPSDVAPSRRAREGTVTKAGARSKETAKSAAAGKADHRKTNPPKSDLAAKSAAHGKPEAKTARDGTRALKAAGKGPAVAPLRAEPSSAGIASRAVIGQNAHRFVPRVLPVSLGSTVQFENRDRVWHNAFSVSPTKRFDLGKYPPGQSRAVTFETPGVVQLFSDIDPAMAGFVFVAPTQYFVKPDAGGAFVLSGLPIGTYTLKAWHPVLGRLTRRVEVTGQGDAHVSLAY